MRLFSLFVLFSSLALLARIVLVAGGYVSGWEAWFADMMSALLLALLCARAPWWLALGLWVAWAVVFMGSMAFLQAMGSAVDYRDLGYLLDPQFLRATLGDRLLPIVVITPLVLLAAGYGFRFCARLRGPHWSSISHWTLTGLVFLIVALQANFTRMPQWSNSGLLPLYTGEILGDLLSGGERVTDTGFDEPEEAPGHPRFPLGQARNVLLVVIEGVHGAYLPQVAAASGETPPVSMSRTGAWAKRGWLVPDFLVHVRKTNRGLYAMLCGDYPRLDGGHPKSMQILNSDEAARRCLPHMLATSGYNTAYIQAADLQFMSKDIVMPQLGYQQLVGREGFADSGVESGTGFSWGPDDQAFFRQTLPRIEVLHRQEKPFFATLLTVGTHYPYAVTADQITEYGNPLAAAVAAADKALDRLLRELEARNILDDTLVIVTNDESHGMPGHWLGQNWGLFFALAPDLAPGQTAEIHSSIDVPNTILDYLGLFPEQRTHLGRSLFRQHTESRAIMFSGSTLKMLDNNGLVHSCTNRVARDGSNLASECVTMESRSGGLFERDYQPAEGDYAERYRFFWKRLMHSLYRFRESKDWKLLVAEQEVLSVGAGTNLAIAHNRVTLPTGSLLTVDFTLAYEGDDDSSMSLEWLQFGVDGQASTLPGVRLPGLQAGDSLRVRYTLPYYGDAAEVELVLKQVAPVSPGRLRLENYRYALQPQEGGREYHPRIHIESDVPGLAAARFTFVAAPEGPGRMQPIRLELAASGQADVFANLGDLAAFSDRVCAAREFSAVERRIIQAYLVYYNRPADPVGLAYWTQRVLNYRYVVGARPAGSDAYLPEVEATNGIDEGAYGSVVQAFSHSDEYARYFSNLDTEQLVANLFRQLFNQDASGTSLQKYSDALKAGTLTRELIALEIAGSANAGQRAILNNRLLVSQRYTTAAEALPGMEIQAPYLSRLITDVGADGRSLLQACARIYQLIADATGE
jgi:hypothetical protein